MERFNKLLTNASLFTTSFSPHPSYGGFFGKNWRKLQILKMGNANRLSSMRRVKREILYNDAKYSHGRVVSVTGFALIGLGFELILGRDSNRDL
jgi:hypothetical protein